MIVGIIVVLIIAYGLIKKQKVYDVFLSGVSEGLLTVLKIYPSLLGLTVAISVFRESGALDFVIGFFSPFFNFIGVPSEVVPLIFVRPISGSASLATLSNILSQYGVDSAIGKLACIIMSSTETILYTLTIYFGCVNIHKIKYTLYPALLSDIVGVSVAIYLIRLTNFL